MVKQTTGNKLDKDKDRTISALQIGGRDPGREGEAF